MVAELRGALHKRKRNPAIGMQMARAMPLLAALLAAAAAASTSRPPEFMMAAAWARIRPGASGRFHERSEATARQELAARVYGDGRPPLDLSAYDAAREAG